MLLEEIHCGNDGSCGGNHDRGPIQTLRDDHSRGTITHVIGTGTMSHINVLRSESTIAVLIVVYGIFLVSAIPYYSDITVDCSEKTIK